MCMSSPKAPPPEPPAPPPIPMIKPTPLAPAVPQAAKNKKASLGLSQLIIPTPTVNIPR